jgi:glycine dehydrogenase
MAGMYAVYHGPNGLRYLAEKVKKHTSILANSLESIGVKLKNSTFFDTIQITNINSEK